MSAPAGTPSNGVITPEMLDLFIKQAQARFMIALLILMGMLAVVLGTFAMALGWRKTVLFFLGIYGGLMTFISVGLCYIFGPLVIVAALAGILREWMSPKNHALASLARSTPPVPEMSSDAGAD